jgi:NinB protein
VNHSNAERAAVQAVPFTTRVFKLVNTAVVEAAIVLLRNLPLSAGLELVIRREPKGRTLDQQARMWVGPLKDMAEQAWIQGRRYSDVVWHEEMKKEYLPDESALSFEELEKRVKDPDNYRKWDIGPKGNRILVGSTTELTKFGFREYLEQVTAYGAGLGVMFTASPNDVQPERK